MIRAALVVLLVLLAGCAGEGRLHLIPRAELPADLYSSPSPQAAAEPAEVVVWMVRDQRLAPSRRTAAASNVSLAEFAARSLLEGPAQEEAATGLGTAIPNDTELLGVVVDGGVARVNVSHQFELGAAQEVLLLRLAQVVYTMTGVPRVDAVEFLVDGEPVNVVDETGSVVTGPVRRSHYQSLAPP